MQGAAAKVRGPLQSPCSAVVVVLEAAWGRTHYPRCQLSVSTAKRQCLTQGLLVCVKPNPTCTHSCVMICSCHCLPCLPGREPSSVKGLLRAGQAAMGLGPGEYSSAAEHLQQALQQARQQQLPTRGEPPPAACSQQGVLLTAAHSAGGRQQHGQAQHHHAIHHSACVNCTRVHTGCYSKQHLVAYSWLPQAVLLAACRGCLLCACRHSGRVAPPAQLAAAACSTPAHQVQQRLRSRAAAPPGRRRATASSSAATGS